MEFIYLLQRESDKSYYSFKIGMTKNIDKRLKAADYRRASIILVRPVPVGKSKEIEAYILSEFNKTFTLTKKYNYEFGKEDFVLRTQDDIYRAINIINDICGSYSLESSSTSNSNTDSEEFNDDFEEPNVDDLEQINNYKFEQIKHIDDDFEEPNVEETVEIKQPNIYRKIKIPFNHFKQIFVTNGLLYTVINQNLFTSYYSEIILNIKSSYNIEYINSITEIKFDRLMLKRSPKISQQPLIKSPYLTQVVKVDNIILCGINESDIYNPLTIKFYVPNQAFEREIKQWELNGVLQEPILLRYYRSHGFNCYGIN